MAVPYCQQSENFAKIMNLGNFSLFTARGKYRAASGNEVAWPGLSPSESSSLAPITPVLERLSSKFDQVGLMQDLALGISTVK